MKIDPRRIEVIDDATAEVLRRMTPAQKLEMANQMVIQGREMIRSIVRSQNPGWPAERVEREVRRRMGRGAA